MDQPLIHDQQTPEGRPATEEELTTILAGMTTFDGTSYLDLYRETQAEEG